MLEVSLAFAKSICPLLPKKYLWTHDTWSPWLHFCFPYITLVCTIFHVGSFSGLCQIHLPAFTEEKSLNTWHLIPMTTFLFSLYNVSLHHFPRRGTNIEAATIRYCLSREKRWDQRGLTNYAQHISLELQERKCMFDSLATVFSRWYFHMFTLMKIKNSLQRFPMCTNGNTWASIKIMMWRFTCAISLSKPMMTQFTC